MRATGSRNSGSVPPANANRQSEAEALARACALSRGALPVLPQLLSGDGARLSARLFQAVDICDHDAVKAILDENMIATFARDADGNTPMARLAQIATRSNDDNCIRTLRALMQGEVPLNVQNMLGETALQLACRVQNYVILSALLQARAEVNREDQFKDTPLMEAVYLKDVGLVKLLLRHRANISDDHIVACRCNNCPAILDILLNTARPLESFEDVEGKHPQNQGASLSSKEDKQTCSVGLRRHTGSTSSLQYVICDEDLLIWNVLKSLTLHDILMKVDLPSGLQHVQFTGGFNESLEKVALPNGLQHLQFGARFNRSLEKVVLPSGLQHLQFGEYFNQSLEKAALPRGLQRLQFGGEFNQSLEKVALPSGLQHLQFGNDFNQSLEKVALPSGLQHLQFGEDFNQNLEKVALPSGLQHLQFGWNLNQRLEKVALPSGLQATLGTP